MIDWNITSRLMRSFPGSFINHNLEFIAHLQANEYLVIETCKSELDVQCKVLEWFSRAAYKTAPFGSERRNREFHRFMLNGINSFLGTAFTEDDMDTIYTYLGNACNHTRTIQFVESGYDMDFFKQFERRTDER